MRPKIGLVLGGGGSRGLAHIGVLQVLEREHIPIDCIVGTSMGAIIGVAYALGMSADAIIHYINRLDSKSLFALNLLTAQARQKMVGDLLQEAFANKTFADLRIPTAVMAADLITGLEVAITDGDLITAVLASSALPGIFPPVEIAGKKLVDGGIIDNVATQPATALGADRIIAIDVYPGLADTWEDPLQAILGLQLPGFLNLSQPNLLTILWRSHRIMACYIHTERLRAHPPDILMRPAIQQYSVLDFKDITGPIAAGAAEAEQHIGALHALLAQAPPHTYHLPLQ